ncbi:hypothetical protein [Pantoea anthophila]|uniref:hypothetical protein n=1 Tax=Pantoea anthophila TaxID=470931 RepID=UPI00301CD564
MMEQLNDLVRLAMRATSDEWTTNDRGGVIAVDDQANDGFVICATSGRDKFHNAEFIAAADPKTIIAIAEAYRALENRLAELEKQEPVGESVNIGGAVMVEWERCIPEDTQLFTRPAPAINLAELVPDDVRRDAMRYRFLRERDYFGADNEAGLASWDDLCDLDCNEFDVAVDARMNHPESMYSSILRNIEGAG